MGGSQSDRSGGRSLAENVLEHHGIRGMKWGVRRSQRELNSSGPQEPEAWRNPKTGKINLSKTRGGQGFAPSTDAKEAVRLAVIASKSGTQALDNQQLKSLNNRLQLEQSYAKLNPKSPGKVKRGQKFTKEILSIGTTVNEIIAFANSPAGKALKDSMGPGGKHRK